MTKRLEVIQDTGRAMVQVRDQDGYEFWVPRTDKRLDKSTSPKVPLTDDTRLLATNQLAAQTS